MRARVNAILIAACLVSLTSVAAFGQSTAEARKSYDAMLQTAKQQFLKCDADAIAAGVTDDYTGLNQTGNVTKGRAAELKDDRGFCAANTVTEWDATTSDFHSSGPIAWAAGTMSMTYKAKATGKVNHIDVRYLATYVRQGDKWFQQYWVEVPKK